MIKTIKASTYHYTQLEDTPSYDEISSVKCDPEGCYDNVKRLSKFLKKKDIEHDIYLTFGIKVLDTTSLYGYHYVIGDRKHNMFFDNQYYHWSAIAVHKWTPEEYKKEKFETSQHADHYLIIFNKIIYYTMLAIKRDVNFPYSSGVSDKQLKKWSFSADPTWAKEPKYGINILEQKVC